MFWRKEQPKPLWPRDEFKKRVRLLVDEARSSTKLTHADLADELDDLVRSLRLDVALSADLSGNSKVQVIEPPGEMRRLFF